MSDCSGRRIVSTWYYEQDAAEGGSYAQVRGDSSAESFRDVYRRCLMVFFVTARRSDPTAELVLYVNSPLRADVSADAAALLYVLTSCSVKVHQLEYTYRPPSTWQHRWRNQFFVFDVLTDLATRTDAGDLLTIIDSDVVWSGTSGTEHFWEQLRKDGAVTYWLPYEPDLRVNGLSRHELTKLAADLGAPPNATLHISGGELIALTGHVAQKVVAEATMLWPELLRRHEAGMLTVGEESHLFSLILHRLDVPQGAGHEYIKRMWTQVFKYRNVGPGDEDLPLWHVPAEKRYGLERIADSIIGRGPEKFINMPQRSFAELLMRELAVPRSSARKTVSDLSRAAVRRMRER